MDRLKRSVRIYDDETLKPIGVFKSEQVGIMKESEMVLDFKTCWPTWVIIALIIIGSICVSFMSFKDVETTKIANKELILENKTLHEHVMIAELDANVEILAGRYATSRTKIPTDKNEIYMMVVQSGAWYPEIIMAQLILESQTGTSNIARNSRNLYGMKKVGLNGRPTLQIPDIDWNGYGMYLNWQHSVLDRVLWDFWLFKKVKPVTREDYLCKIDGVYAEDPDYISKILNIAKEWEPKTESVKTMLEQDPSILIQ